MTTVDATFFGEMTTRGLIHQCTDEEFGKRINAEQLTIYCGFDPTSDSLHIGSLLPLMMLRRLQQAGHKVIAVVGGATGLIGDPSGKSSERTLMTKERLAHNLAGISRVIAKFLQLDGPNPAVIVDNADWGSIPTYLEFIRDIGKHFTVNYMMAKDSVRERLESRDQGISYTEFSYMILQAYDFYVLNKERGCTVQIGGSDQWGNITAGCDLIRKLAAFEERPAPHVYGLTFPLITKSDGTKFGKSESGTIWLDPGRTSPYAFYQFLIQTVDADVMGFLNRLSTIPTARVAELAAELARSPETRSAQKELARDLTRLVHGEEELHRVESASAAFFAGELARLDGRTLREVTADVPTVTKTPVDFQTGLLLVDMLVETKLCDSKGAARKDIQGGGIYVNNQKVQDLSRRLTTEDVLAQTCVVLRKGKRNYATVLCE